MHRSFVFIKFLIGVSLVCFSASSVWAQSEDIDASFKTVTPQERVQLQAILDEPLDKTALKIKLEQQVFAKTVAARRLGVPDAEEQILTEALTVLDLPNFKNNLANIYRNKGQYAKALALHKELADNDKGFAKPFQMCQIANDYLTWGKYTEARTTLENIKAQIDTLTPSQKSRGAERILLRATLHYGFHLSRLEQATGHIEKAIEAANFAEIAARKAYPISLPGDAPNVRLNLSQDLAKTLARKTQALLAAGRFADAEDALRNYVRFSSEAELPIAFKSGIYSVATDLRFAQREFAQSEKLAVKADQILESLGEPGSNLERINRRRDIFVAMMGEKKWPEALAEVQRLDAIAGDDPALKRRVQFNFDRGYVYLGNQMNEPAAELFERAAAGNAKIYDEDHFYVAQSKGLQGVALWRSADAAKKQAALPLLEQASLNLISPRNADYLNQFGIRPETRKLIIGTYIEALAQTNPERVTQTLGLADWLHAGAVQEALSDAAVRSAANTQGLSELVRQEQDAKNEVQGLRAYLAGEAGSAQSPLPEVATQMRERIALLEKQRTGLQAKIKQGFPDYERLVHPLPPTLDDIGAKLTSDEALLVLMPDATGVNVWAVKQDAGKVIAKFHRASLTQAQLEKSVATLRVSLESLGTTGRLKPFDDALAFQTYQALIAPLSAELADRKQWILATSGALARLPFAVLQTQARQGKQAPSWLIQQVSLSQVPSVSSWLSLRSLKRQQLPQQALLAWGDPVFDPSAAVVSDAPAGVRNVNFTRSLSQDIELEAEPGDKIYHSIPTLPDTRDELNALATALNANLSQDLLLGSNATRASVLSVSKSGLLAQKKVIVFATHGLMAGDLPHLTQPALALAADGSESKNALAPLLTLEDVLGLKLNADWVVLSACNTAAADGRAEEALSGLARGFFYAGSRSMLVTHWAVESESAKELTTRTFGHFTHNPQAPKAESLRQAILQVMADPRYGHPAFWAPYVLVGDSQR